MKFFKLAKTFSRDEDGAVTVDWVVLTAAIVGLGIAVITSVSKGVDDLGADIATELKKDSLIGMGTGYNPNGTTTTDDEG